jgi:hypothetical protein
VLVLGEATAPTLHNNSTSKQVRNWIAHRVWLVGVSELLQLSQLYDKAFNGQQLLNYQHENFIRTWPELWQTYDALKRMYQIMLCPNQAQ